MSILLLASASGAPGVTTTALGLALCWPRDVLLVDADPHPSRSIEAGYLGGRTGVTPGLSHLAIAHRTGVDMTAALWQQVVELPRPVGSPGCQVSFLAGFTHPGQAGLMGVVWPSVARALRDLDDAGIDVIVDLGRMSGTRPPDELVSRAAAVGIVTRSSLRSLAGLALQAQILDEMADSTTARTGLVLIGVGQPYGVSEIATQFRRPVLAEVADDHRGASVLSDGAPGRWHRSRHAGSLRHAADRLAAVLAEHHRTAGLPGAEVTP
ncbi:hypothetical protein [Acidipropionibacterium timonense]|uniref:hypothetical protein n=1 Tax=Acidipropionibacterium timonense TaxID=2161818 RepID=UPI001031E9C0|nr:hypothetical protein [Acidipropionibacterium timonense]